MVEAARMLPTLMANETRLAHALRPVLRPVCLHYHRHAAQHRRPAGQRAGGRRLTCWCRWRPATWAFRACCELQRTIDAVRMHFRPDLKIFGYLPTLCDEQRSEAQEILAELEKRYPG